MLKPHPSVKSDPLLFKLTFNSWGRTGMGAEDVASRWNVCWDSLGWNHFFNYWPQWVTVDVERSRRASWAHYLLLLYLHMDSRAVTRGTCKSMALKSYVGSCFVVTRINKNGSCTTKGWKQGRRKDLAYYLDEDWEISYFFSLVLICSLFGQEIFLLASRRCYICQVLSLGIFRM